MAKKLKGQKELERNLKAFLKDTKPGVAKALDNKARLLMGRAIAVAPEDTRELILSAKVTRRSSSNSEERVVSFGTDHGVIQHEGTFNPGPLTAAKAATQDGAAGRKYLQRPFDNMVASGEIEREVAKGVIAAARKNAKR